MTQLHGKQALTYDDIQLIPAYSDIESRQNIDLSTQLTTNYRIRVPLVASPMDTVCDGEMAVAMAHLGGVGCIHRFNTIEQQVSEVRFVLAHPFDTEMWPIGTMPVMAAVGANGDYLERAQELVKAGANVILIDVAHGYHKFVMEAIRTMKMKLPTHVNIIAGNVATGDAAFNLAQAGADAIRVGIGGGSLCTTRVKTGFGVPNVTSLIDCAGSNSVILGSLIAGTKEAPGPMIEKANGLYKRYRGAASLETKSIHGQATRNVEGESTIVPFKGKVKFVVDGLLDGLRSALSYAGANNLREYFPEYVVVTNAGVREAQPHLL